MGTKIIEINGKKVRFKKNAQNKKIKLRINQKGEVLVSLPVRCAFSQAISFVEGQWAWVEENLQKITKNAKKTKIFDENTVFSTKNHILFIEKANIKKSISSIKDGKIHIKFPLDEDILLEKNQQKIKKAIIETLRQEAKDFLPKRVDFWAKKYNLDFSEINIKNMTSRWGSCSSLGAITLNLHLMRLPLELIDYVILHELAHLKHHNHSERFWTFLDKICPESDVFNKKLKFYKVDFLI